MTQHTQVHQYIWQGQDAASTSDVKYPGLYKPGQAKAAAAAAASPATGSSDVQYPGLYKPNKPLKVSITLCFRYASSGAGNQHPC